VVSTWSCQTLISRTLSLPACWSTCSGCGWETQATASDLEYLLETFDKHHPAVMWQQFCAALQQAAVVQQEQEGQEEEEGSLAAGRTPPCPQAKQLPPTTPAYSHAAAWLSQQLPPPGNDTQPWTAQVTGHGQLPGCAHKSMAAHHTVHSCFPLTRTHKHHCIYGN
jgi:hypothetical protein